ncbi:unnamed protein product [Parnassius apollo]|uniref:(apollo) hypothetical protein n=1 Tax=Parnassius apollo TaxID=110799 RepID=A0A8S3Y6Y8_PARAO|nr:unnamed protein product [Parnassius apollo]
MSNTEDFSDSGSEYQPIPGEIHTESETDTSCDENIMMPSSLSEPGTSKSRKRSINKENWTVNKRKLLRNSGKGYVTKIGVEKNTKIFENIDCGCPKKCYTLFTENERQEMFESFWNLKDFNQQNAFLYALVQKASVNRKRPKDLSRAGKNVSFKYFLKSHIMTQLVCKKYFLKTFQISDGRLYRCLSKGDVSQCKDKRGTTSTRKLDDSDIIAHIQSFPAYQSHYTRKSNPNRKFLNPGLTIRKMYDLYKEKCLTEMTEPKKLKYYNKVFNTKFNLHFKAPHQDTCKTCDSLNFKIRGTDDENVKKEFEVQKELHQRKADSARENLQIDAKKINDAYVLTFDLQKALAFPKLTTSVAYYKRNLYLYNLGIHCFNNNTGYMNVWNEIEGGRGSQDIAVCLVKHLKTHAVTQNHVIMYSDSCTGQNRNIKTTLSLLKLVQDPDTSITTIDHKFLVSGHSYLPNDGEFGIIESASRRHGQIYSPDQWIEIMKTAKRKEPHFVVTEIKNSEFKSTAALEKCITNRKKNNLWLRLQLAEY